MPEGLAFDNAVNKIYISWSEAINAWNFSAQEEKAEELGVQDHPWLHSQFKASLGNMIAHVNQKKKFMRSFMI